MSHCILHNLKRHSHLSRTMLISLLSLSATLGCDESGAQDEESGSLVLEEPGPVSYTHLTLPTIYSV